MPRKSLSLAIVAATAAVVTASGSSADRLLIGDVISESESLRGSSSSHQRQNNQHQQRSLNNVDILNAMLGKEHFDIDRDECLQPATANNNGTNVAIYGKCDIRHFPYCNGDDPTFASIG
eukprot:CAMPEP_0172319878 /NCGR_PEP_ID=MMETSP1058-20130122/38949_1 /TAXON_ID=83371 /ORGANISM="Detonula confervacea, Strain CCMP 353" /LENGTH=119 /DNA_ID=CAMNT_0013035021 /DNA_START=43 /DNA_END=403 /DNA_ORIENTATION=-